MTRKQKKMLLRIISSAVLFAASWFFDEESLQSIACAMAAYLVIGYDVLFSAFRNIINGQVFDEKFLMGIATFGAIAVREYREAAAVMLFFQIGELFESIAVGRSRKSIAALMDIRPEEAVVIRGGTEEVVAPEEVMIGETLIVRPGEKISLDGRIIDGRTAVNTAALTGESIPVDKETGDRVISGSINISGLIKVEVESRYEDSTVSKILELVENSSEKKAKLENFITRFARYYTPCVVTGAVLLAALPPLLFRQSWEDWLYRALIFLVVSCPCALVVSVPLSFFAGIGGASKKGILIKGANYLEMLSKVQTIVFDKTGTLTKGIFTVRSIYSEGLAKEELLSVAALAESASGHPVAESILRAYGKPLENGRLKSAEELAGMGIHAVIDGSEYFVGNAKLMCEAGAVYKESEMPGTVVHVSQGKKYLGHIVISDEIKADSAAALASLKKLGLKKTVMLTGDNEKTAEAVGRSIGIDEVHSGLLPADKVARVEGLIGEGKVLAYVGDGINDAPVLMRADVGIAMGAMGSDAAIESADIVLMDDTPSKIPFAIRISKKVMRVVRQNIVMALGIKFLILLLAALGYADMWIAIFGDVGVLVLAVLNSILNTQL